MLPESQQQTYVISHCFKSVCVVLCACDMLIKCIFLLSVAVYDCCFQTSSCQTKETETNGEKEKMTRDHAYMNKLSVQA